ncbi:MAG TPA: hypothetical protein VJ869_16155 [Sphaerochaeta sp.]|nr:hypothetical protein [Sphaerochaeta sp.]
MDRQDVMDTFAILANSQGFYGRLLQQVVRMDEEEQDEYFSQFKDCEDALDVVMVVEG